jgi:hypothetical protein
VNGRQVTEDEATTLRLPSLKPTPALEDWQRILYQAADILEHMGWCRGELKRGPRHCAVGAIIAAYQQGDVQWDEGDLWREPTLECVIHKVQRYLNHSLMDWNDSMAKSGRNVAAVLRASAIQG